MAQEPWATTQAIVIASYMASFALEQRGDILYFWTNTNCGEVTVKSWVLYSLHCQESLKRPPRFMGALWGITIVLPARTGPPT